MKGTVHEQDILFMHLTLPTCCYYSVVSTERDEFVAAMRQLNPDLSMAQTNALFQRIDQDGNHTISFIEFLAAALDPKDVDRNEMKQVI